MKYFTKQTYESVDELKKEFRALMMIHHPDRNPDKDTNEICAMIINEYESLIKTIVKKASKEREQSKPRENRKYYAWDYYTYDESFVKAMMETIAIISKNGLNNEIEIEVCGFFFYVIGNTKAIKSELKVIGLKWMQNKLAWAFCPDWWKASKGHKPWEFDKVREVYGSEKVNVGREEGLVAR